MERAEIWDRRVEMRMDEVEVELKVEVKKGYQ